MVLIILFQVVNVSGQPPVLSTPQPAEFEQYGISGFSSQPAAPVSPSFPYDNKIQRQNEFLMREALETERRRAAISRQHALREQLKAITVSLPDFSAAPGTGYFHAARNEIQEMLEDKRQLSLKRAVFITENAFFQERMRYEEFDVAIQNLKRICLLKMQEEKLDEHDNLAKLMMIFRILSEVVTVKEPGTEKQIIHHPVKYDFDDYRAEDNQSNYMVSKLLSKNTGQCHSMPLLFLILAEEMDAEAFWCFSPSHSFIKIKDKQERWYNIELTQASVVTDDFYMNSGFIKSKAIQSGIYLNPLTPRQAIAHLLNDLSFYYISRYGNDRFVEENCNQVLRYAPSDLTAYQIRANVYTEQAMYVIDACGRPPESILPEYPQAYNLFKQMLQSYEKIDSLGYEAMPAEMYRQWLNQLDKEKVLPQNQPSPVIQFKK